MPKKSGIMKTYSFDVETVGKLKRLCDKEHRTQTNMLEVLIADRYERERMEDSFGSWTDKAETGDDQAGSV